MATFQPAADRLPIGHELVEGELHHAITVYGTGWCKDTVRARALLDRLGVEYNYYDMDLDPAMAKTAYALQGGGQKRPVLDFHEEGDGAPRILVEPSDDELTDALRQTGRIHD